MTRATDNTNSISVGGHQNVFAFAVEHRVLRPQVRLRSGSLSTTRHQAILVMRIEIEGGTVTLWIDTDDLPAAYTDDIACSPTFDVVNGVCRLIRLGLM